MMEMYKCVVILTCLVYSCAAKVLLISMDGFRWDYIQSVATPNFDAFAGSGTRASYVNNTFITKTFPCHYSIATGLYEESHGIVANHMYDPVFNATFGMGTTETRWWDGGEPIWVTARKRGLKSAVFFWPGSEAEIRGFRPNIWLPYEQSIPFKQRVDTVVKWFTNDSLGIDLALLYFHEPDLTGHIYGPDSPEIQAKVGDMDTLLGYIVQQFEAHALFDSVNVIVTSDHGMTEIDLHNRVIDLSQLVDTSAILRMPDSGPAAAIEAVDGMEDELVANLSRIHHVTTYRKTDIPEHWHYSNNHRIMPILCVADEGWIITKSIAQSAGVENTLFMMLNSTPDDCAMLFTLKDITISPCTNATGQSTNGKGSHGFDNRLQSMKPIFYARGPNIRRNYTVSPFNSVDIYPLIAELLGIRPAVNNGTLDNTKEFIVSTDTSGATTAGVRYKLMAIILCLILAS